jgi:16S rRNA processing protein RimM
VLGEVVVDLVTDRTERLAPGTTLEAGDPPRHLTVRTSRRQGPGSRWLVVFDGVASREDAERLRAAVLRAPALPADPGVLFVHELIGAEVWSADGRRAGTVIAVEANPASDLLALDSGALVPARFVVSHEPGVRVTIDVPPGLLPEDAPAGDPPHGDPPEDPTPT